VMVQAQVSQIYIMDVGVNHLVLLGLSRMKYSQVPDDVRWAFPRPMSGRAPTPWRLPSASLAYATTDNAALLPTPHLPGQHSGLQ
jgi:hypothetical protein